MLVFQEEVGLDLGLLESDWVGAWYSAQGRILNHFFCKVLYSVVWVFNILHKSVKERDTHKEWDFNDDLKLFKCNDLKI